MRKIGGIALEQGASRVAAVKVKIGAFAHISPEHFREHFEQATRGTIADGARLDIVLNLDPDDPSAQDILLDSVEVED